MSSLVLGESEGVPAIGQSDHLHQRRIGLICDGHPLTAVMSVPAPGKSKIVNHQEIGGHGGDPCFSAGPKITSVPFLPRKKYRKVLSRRIEYAVFSVLRTNSAEMPVESLLPGSRAEATLQGRRGGESESLEEEAIEIGNS